MDEFLKIKLKRIVWIAFLEQKNIVSAAESFRNYIGEVNTFTLNTNNLNAPAKKEKKFATDLYVTKLKEIAEKFFTDKDYANAAICFSLLFEVKPDEVNYINYLKTLNQLKQFDLFTDILLYYEKTTFINVNFYKDIATFYYESKDYEKAIKYYEKFMASPEAIKTSEDYNWLGCYYDRLYSSKTYNKELLDKSIDYFKIAYGMKPCRLYVKNLIIMLTKTDNNLLTKKYWEELIAKYDMTNDDKYDYARFCLKTRNFDGWHKYYDSRFLKENDPTRFPVIHKPKWDGKQDLSNSTLLIYAEQGFGDIFLTFGYCSRLQKLAKKIIFVTYAETVSLLKNNNFGIEIISQSVDLKKINFDYYLPAMSIPITLKYNREDLPTGGGYLKPKDDLKAEFKEKYFNSDKFKIGIAYFGMSSGDKSRDINIKEFLPLDSLDNVELYSLHIGISDNTFDIFKRNKINNIGKNFRNFEDTAAAIANLDLVLTSDNVILNLAGAMGKKTFALFNFIHQSRWFDLSGENVVWYDSVKPFINDEQDNWQYSMGKAIEEIKKLIK